MASSHGATACLLCWGFASSPSSSRALPVPTEQPRGGGTAGTAALQGSIQGLSRHPLWPSHGRAEKSPVLLLSPSILGAEPLPWASSRPEEQLQDHAWAMEGRRQCACCWRCLQSVGLGAPRHEMASNQAQCGCSVRNPELSIRDAQRLSLNCADKASLGPLVTPGPAVAVCVWVHLSWTEVPLLPPLFAGCLVDPLSPSNLWGFSHYG